MENKNLLKGIILTTATTGNFDSDVLYFVRTNSGKTDGYLQLNGKKYGTAEEIKTLLGELPEGFATWRAFVDSISGATTAITEDIEALSAATSGIAVDVETLNANSGVSGSVDQKIATAIAGLDGTTANTKPAENAYVADVTETDGIVTVTYGTLPTESQVTATGDTLVSATATGHSVTVGATEALTSAVTNANSAVQSVNEKSGTAVTIDATEIEVGDDITGDTTVTATTTVQAALQDLYDKSNENADDIEELQQTAIKEVALDNGNVVLVDASGLTTTGFAATAITSGVSQDIVALSGLTSANTEAIELLNADSATTGSVDNKIATAIADVNGDVDDLKDAVSANTEAIETLNGDDTTEGSVAKSVKDAIAGLDGTTANTKPAENAFVADVTETDGIVTVTYGSYPDVTATGDTLVSASATDHAVTVSATQALTDAVTAAGTAVQSVNGESGTAVTINADDIELGTAVMSGSTTILPATSSITQSFDDVYQKIDAASNASKIESTGQTITVTTGATGNNVEVNLETGTASTVDAGHIEIAKNANGELYGMLYYGGDDVE